MKHKKLIKLSENFATVMSLMEKITVELDEAVHIQPAELLKTTWEQMYWADLA